MPSFNSLLDTTTTVKVQLSDGSIREFQATGIKFSMQRDVTPVRWGGNVVELVPGRTTQTFNIVMEATVQDPEPSPSRYDLLKAAVK